MKVLFFIRALLDIVLLYRRVTAFLTEKSFQSANSDMTVVAFLIFPARTENFNVESLRGHAVTKSLRDTILEIQTKIGRRIYEICLR